MMEVHGEGTKEAKIEEEHQIDQNVQIVQISSDSPQTYIVKVKDVSNTTIQNSNPLIEEDMQKILIDSITKEQE